VAPTNGSSYLQISPGGPGQGFSLQVQSFNPTDLNLVPASGGATHPMGIFRIDMSTPASSSAPCTAGQMTFDASYQYDCVATNTGWIKPVTEDSRTSLARKGGYQS